MSRHFNFAVLLALLFLANPNLLNAQRTGQASTKTVSNHAVAPDDIAAGRDLILNHSFLPRDFHQSVFDELWKDWPEPLRSQAEKANKAARRELAFKRFGLSSREDNPDKPLQFVVDDEGYWSMNCFACHGGSVEGKTIEGLPNAQLALETLYEDFRRTKRRMKLPLSPMDIGSTVIPMGTSVGTSNAVVFGIVLMLFRDKDLNLRPLKALPELVHHDVDAPPWWNVSQRDRLYIDGFVEKNHRALIPFVMDQRNSGETMRGWEDEFKKVFAYIESLEAPVFPMETDRRLLEMGSQVFQQNCATCHGSYEDDGNAYPSKIVPIDDIGTDRVRLDALTVEYRKGYHESWYAHYGADETVFDPDGYQAPPLNGIWASAPYLHNGSVPTLWHLLHPEERPKVWHRPNQDEYDFKRVGLRIVSLDELPEDLRSDQKREYFDTSVKGKSAKGHDYPNSLNTKQKLALLEYLKTL